MFVDLIQHLAIDDLSDDMKLIAQSCGLDVARSLMEKCPGVQIYIPRSEHIEALILREMHRRYGARKLTASEIKAMSIELRKSPAYVRKVAKKLKEQAN